MVIKLHGVERSTCTARVLLCLLEKGLPYELVTGNLASAAHKQESYLSLNPFGQIPALEDGETTLFESRAINRYICRKHNNIGTDLLRSSSLQESAMVDTWLEVEAHQFNGPISTIVFQIMVNPKLGLAPNDEIVESELKKLEKVLDVYEERLSKNKYLAGDSFTLADLNHIPYLVYFMRTPPKISGLVISRPRVTRWWNDISSRPATIKVSAGMNL